MAFSRSLEFSRRRLAGIPAMLLAALLLLGSSQALGFFQRVAGDYDIQVQQMYVAYYGRPGDPEGVDYWSGRLAEVGGNWIADLIEAFGTSTEYVMRFGTLDDSELVDNLFQQLFNRTADTAGRAFYIDLIGGTNQSGLNTDGRQSTLAQIALDIANGAQNDDLAILQNKLTVAEYFTEQILSTGGSYTSNDIDDAVEIIAAVDNTGASVDAARGRVDEFTGAVVDDTPENDGPHGSLQITGSSEVIDSFVPGIVSGGGLGADSGLLQMMWFENSGLALWTLTLSIADGSSGISGADISFGDSLSTTYQCQSGFVGSYGDCSGATYDNSKRTVMFSNVELQGPGFGTVITLNGTLKY